MPALLRRMFWNFISQAEDACKRTLSSLRLPKKVSRANARDLVPNLSSFSVLPEPYQDLRIAIDSLIEFIVSIRGVFNRYVMTDDAPWLGAARYDQIPQIFVVSLDRSLPPLPMVSALSKKSTTGKGNIPFLASLVISTRIGGNVHADQANRPGRVYHPNHIFQHLGWLLCFRMLVISRLISHGVDRAVNSLQFFFSGSVALLNHRDHPTARRRIATNWHTGHSATLTTGYLF